LGGHGAAVVELLEDAAHLLPAPAQGGAGRAGELVPGPARRPLGGLRMPGPLARGHARRGDEPREEAVRKIPVVVPAATAAEPAHRRAIDGRPVVAEAGLADEEVLDRADDRL